MTVENPHNIINYSPVRRDELGTEAKARRILNIHLDPDNEPPEFVKVEGVTPCCDGRYNEHEFDLYGVAPDGIDAAPALPDQLAVRISCECGELHPGAPKDVFGCGRSFELEVWSK